MINTQTSNGGGNSILSRIAGLESARKNSQSVEKKEDLSGEYERLVDSFQSTLTNVMALDGSERDRSV